MAGYSRVSEDHFLLVVQNVCRPYRRQSALQLQLLEPQRSISGSDDTIASDPHRRTRALGLVLLLPGAFQLLLPRHSRECVESMLLSWAIPLVTTLVVGLRRERATSIGAPAP